jgi:2-keto-3-deoxy-L-rhamnonate aldolase RhmA
MPPRGRRSPGGRGNRWVSDVNYATWRAEVEDDLIVLAQIESRTGLACVDEIARHELTTALAIGPYDLSADLGACWEPEHPELVKAIEKIREAAAGAGKNTWMIGAGPDLVRRGFTFICIGEPVMVMESTLGQLAEQLRASAAKVR